MFDPIPTFASADSHKNSADLLLLFSLRIKLFSKRYNIHISNRFIGILDCCDTITHRLSDNTSFSLDAIRMAPSEEIQNILQLLTYLLCDQGLLYNDHGNLRTVPDENSWEQSEISYKEFAFALRNRHFAALQIEGLRNRLNIHIKQCDSLSMPHNKQTTPADVKLIESLSKNLASSVSRERIESAVKSLRHDWLFSIMKPLFLFFALIINTDNQPYDAARYKRDLKRNKTHFPAGSAPQKLLKQREHWRQYVAIEKSIFEAVQDNDKTLEPSHRNQSFQFDPFSLLIQIRQRTNLSLSDKDLSIIANKCQDHFLFDARTNEDLSSSIKVGDIDIFEIMSAFYRIFQSQSLQHGDTPDSLPYARKKSLDTLLKSGLLHPSDISLQNDAVFSEEEYNKLRQAVYLEYGTPLFSLSQEAFWLLSSYTPPSDLLFDSDNDNLYELCYDKISNIFFCMPFFRNRSSRSLSLSQKQHSDILNARGFWATNWNDKTARSFWIVLSEYSLNKDDSILIKWINEQYAEIKDKNHNFESFKSIPDIMYTELLDESIMLSEIHLREQVLSTMVKVSGALWPLAPGSDGKKLSVSSPTDASPPVP